MATKRTLLLVMDESDCRETNVFALVGLVVPIERADALRVSLHRFVRELENPPDRTIATPTELHGSAMLKNVSWATDEHRLRCYQYVVDVLHEHQLQILRAAYYKKSLAALPGGKRMMYGLCFGGMQATVGSLLADAYAIPIMDGMNQDLAFSFGGGMPVLHALRASPFYAEGSISIPNVENLMDAVFVDSRYSALMQLADVTAHLLHILDWERLGLPLVGAFKPRLAAIARRLDMSLVSGAVPVSMRMAGIPAPAA